MNSARFKAKHPLYASATIFFLFFIAATIPLAAQRSPYAGVISIPGVVEAENYDNGGEGLTWHDTTPGNAFGVYRLNDVDVGAITAGGYFIGAIDTGEWTEYSVNVATPGNYSVTVRWASAYPSSTTFRVLMNGVDVAGTQTITPTGDWQTFQTKTFTAFNLAAGPQILRISFDTGSWNLDSLQFTAIAGQRSPYAGVIAIPGLVQAENYDNGGEGLTWHDTTPGNAFGVYRLNDVDVGAITGGGYFIGNVAAGEWAEYSVNVTTPGSYTVAVRSASADPTSTTFHLTMNGTSAGGTQPITYTGDWQTFTTSTFTVNNVLSGPQILRVTFDSGSVNLDSLQFTANTSCTAPTVSDPMTPPPKPEPTAHPDPETTATLTVTAGGSPTLTYQWYKDNAPLTDVSGHISGSNTNTLSVLAAEQWRDAGSYTVKVSNACGFIVSKPGYINVQCGGPPSPGMIAENIYRAMAFSDNRDTCDWQASVRLNYTSNISYGGSYNIPVVAAAVGYIKSFSPGAPTWNMEAFWDNYLRGELGERSDWNYAGLEMGSADYGHFDTMAILAVHYWAHQKGDTNIEALSRRWLRATFALDALAAVPQQPLTEHADGSRMTVKTKYTGPYVAMVGERSAWGFWLDFDRSIMFANAVGLGANTNDATELPQQQEIRTFVQSWPDVYGLTAADQTYLQRIMNSGTLVPYSDGGSVPYLTRDFLGSIHPATTYKFVAWPRVKATVLTQSRNPNTVATFGMAYFLDPNLAAGREAHFLYPWSQVFQDGDAFKNDVCTGTGLIDLINHVMQGSHPDCPPIITYDVNGKPVVLPTIHPAQTSTIANLPAATPNYVVTLDPTLPPTCTPACP